jgi:cytochrome b
MAASREERAVWDLPTRLFHWSLAAFVVFSYVTGRLGGSWMPWHMRSGYAILALLLFRIAWGIGGPAPSRFARFVRGPRAALEHARALAARLFVPSPGHTPLGGWMVVAMLAVLALQAATGLFSNDESSHEGPLAAKVSEAMVDRLSAVHGYNQWLIVVLVVVHIGAVAFYQWGLRADVVKPMLGGAGPDGALLARATAFLAAAAGIVYMLVVVYPSR